MRRLTFLGLALLLIAGGLALALHRPPPPAPPLEQQLARARAFAADRGLQLAPRFSPDGRYVAFALAEGDEESRIVVQALDGSSRRFIGSDGLRVSPVFFPDGRRIAFWQAADGGCGIFEHDLQSGAERRLVDCAMLPRVRFDISPDGRSIVFTAATSPDVKAGLWIAPVEGAAPRPLTLPPEDAGDDLHPRFSPDGREVAFFRGREGLRQPWVAPIDASAPPRAAGRECGRCFGLAWVRAGGELLVAADWYGEPGLRAVDASSGRTRIVSSGAERFPDVSPAGDIVYELAHEPDARPKIEAAAHAPAAPGPAQIDLMIAPR